jgi:hypothetical protein
MQIDAKFLLKIMRCCINLRPGLKKLMNEKRAQMCNLLYCNILGLYSNVKGLITMETTVFA